VLGLLVRGGDAPEIEPYLQKLLRTELLRSPQQSAETFQSLGALLARSPDKQKSYEIATRLTQPYPQSADAHWLRAQFAWQAGQFEAARLAAEKALTLKPDWIQPVLMIAQAHLQASPANPDASLKVLKQYLKDYPDNIDIRSAYARTLLNQERAEDALVQYAEIQRKKPNEPAYTWLYALAAAQTKNYGLAEKLLSGLLDTLNQTQVLPTNNNNESDSSAANSAAASAKNTASVTEVRLMLAQLADDQNQPQRAIAWLTPLVGKDKTPMVRNRLAQLYSKTGDAASANAQFTETSTSNAQEKVMLALYQSQWQQQTGNIDAAGNTLLNIATQMEDSELKGDVLYEYALILEKQKQYDNMEVTLLQSIALKPESAAAYNALGYSLAERRIRLDEADSLLQKAIELSPDDASIMDSVGWLKFQQQKFAEAEQWLKRAYSAKAEPDIGVHLAEVLWVSKQTEAALILLRAVQKKNPKHELLLETLQRLQIKL
jgi:Flp pilus assembly protein TadD